MNRLRQVTNFIYEMEDNLNLFNHKINGVYYWKIIRVLVFDQITNEIGMFDDAHPLVKVNKVERYVNTFIKEFKILKYNAAHRKSNPNIIIFDSPRKSIYKDQKVDIYTYFLEEELFDNCDNEIEHLELATFENTYCKEKKISIALDSIIVFKFKRKTINISFDKNDVRILNVIKNEIWNIFSIEIDIVTLVTSSIKNFLIKYQYYCKLFKAKKPNTIYIVCSYGLEPLISAAQDNEVTVKEIQHGTMSRDHVGYSFPNNKAIPYFPDKLLMFGTYWSEITPLPLDKKNIEYYGYPYLNKQLKKYENTKKIKNKIIFLSQGTIAKELIKLAFEFAKNNEQYIIEYKLHPSEYSVWRNIYPLLLKASNLNNFSVVDNNEKNLYHLLAESECQVGVYSTVIYEGLAMNLKTILINLPGIEYMEYLINNNIVLAASNEKELLSCVMNTEISEYKKEYFFI